MGRIARLLVVRMHRLDFKRGTVEEIDSRVPPLGWQDADRADSAVMIAGMTNLKPVPKVAAAGASGALTTVLVIVANAVGLDLPPEAASAIVLLGTLAGGWLKRDKPKAAAPA